jgi:hypothetical protein
MRYQRPDRKTLDVVHRLDRRSASLTDQRYILAAPRRDLSRKLIEARSHDEGKAASRGAGARAGRRRAKLSVELKTAVGACCSQRRAAGAPCKELATELTVAANQLRIVDQAMMDGRAGLGVAACACCERFHALSFALVERPRGVEHEEARWRFSVSNAPIPSRYPCRRLRVLRVIRRPSRGLDHNSIQPPIRHTRCTPTVPFRYASTKRSK